MRVGGTRQRNASAFRRGREIHSDWTIGMRRFRRKAMRPPKEGGTTDANLTGSIGDADYASNHAANVVRCNPRPRAEP